VPSGSSALASTPNTTEWTEHQIDDLIRTGFFGSLIWARRYLAHHYFGGESAAFHHETMGLAEYDQRLAVGAPRSHAKTTNLALAFPLFRMAVHHEAFTLVISDTSTQAEQRTSDIHAELLENKLLTGDYPYLSLPDAEHYRQQKAKRTQGDFITVGGLRVLGAGAGKSLRGVKDGANRPSLIICDDLENDEAVATPLQREKLWSWFTKSILNLPGPDGARFIVIGTILHRQSLLARLLNTDDGQTWTRRLYRAINADGEVLWPAVWTREKLEHKRL
jgi:hypothetical protein